MRARGDTKITSRSGHGSPIAGFVLTMALSALAATAGTSCRGCYALEGCGETEPCEKIAKVGRKCVVKSKGKSLELLEKECMTATRRGKHWVRWYLQCFDKWGMDCKAFKECLRLKEKRERQHWNRDGMRRFR